MCTRVRVLVAHQLICSTARGIFQDQGPNLRPLHWPADFYPLHHQSSPALSFLKSIYFKESYFFLVISHMGEKAYVKYLDVDYRSGHTSKRQLLQSVRAWAWHAPQWAWEDRLMIQLCLSSYTLSIYKP